LLVKRQRAINRQSPKEKERVEFKRRWDEWYNELAVNLSYLPMTIHWYLPSFAVHAPSCQLTHRSHTT
jgi:hypothetical protein